MASLFGDLAKKAAAIENKLKDIDTKATAVQKKTLKYIDKVDNLTKNIDKKITKSVDSKNVKSKK